MSLEGGKLSLDPPDTVVLRNLLKTAATQTLQHANIMPLSDGSNHAARGDANDQATKVAYPTLSRNQ